MKILIKSQLKKLDSSGFALLLTLVIISVILAIGLTLLQITMKQLSLSAIARESEIAFYVASTGVECMQFHSTNETTRAALILDSGNPDIRALECAGQPPLAAYTQVSTIPLADNAQRLYSRKYRYNLSIYPTITTDDTCLETSLYLADMRLATNDMNAPLNNEGLDSFSCEAGSICTTIFSRGYNRGCDDLDSIFTIQRELTLEF